MILDYNEAHQTRLLVSVTFHFRPDRLRHLFQVVKTLVVFPVAALDIVVVTNTALPADIAAIRELCDPLVGSSGESSLSRKTLAVRSFTGLADPWYLPWSHKILISELFVGRRDYTHYINLEDDLELSFASFCFFLRYRPTLKARGLIPSFIRVEYNYTTNLLYCTDQWEVTRTDNRRVVEIDGYWFMNIENPHIGMFILDQELAEEYVSTRSFDMKRSEAVHTWGVCERASMALCFENVPKGFYVRYVVPVHPRHLTVPSEIFVYHVANNYTNNPSHPHGKIPVTRLFSHA